MIFFFGDIVRTRTHTPPLTKVTSLYVFYLLPPVGSERKSFAI